MNWNPPPFFFASNAIYPIKFMLPARQVIVRVHSLRYEVDALPGMMVVGGEHVNNIGVDFAVVFAITAILNGVAVRLFPRLIQ